MPTQQSEYIQEVHSRKLVHPEKPQFFLFLCLFRSLFSHILSLSLFLSVYVSGSLCTNILTHTHAFCAIKLIAKEQQEMRWWRMEKLKTK